MRISNEDLSVRRLWDLLQLIDKTNLNVEILFDLVRLSISPSDHQCEQIEDFLSTLSLLKTIVVNKLTRNRNESSH